MVVCLQRISRFTSQMGKSPYSERNWRAGPSGTGNALPWADAMAMAAMSALPSDTALSRHARSAQTLRAGSLVLVTVHAA